MRMLLKAVFDTEATNELFRSGEVSAALARLQEVLQPEAYYGFVEDGQRTSIYVFDMADSSQIPVIAEPMFQQECEGHLDSVHEPLKTWRTVLRRRLPGCRLCKASPRISRWHIKPAGPTAI